MTINNSCNTPRLSAKGDVLCGCTGNGRPKILSLGTDGQVLVADSTRDTGVKWDNVPSAISLTDSTTNRSIPTWNGTSGSALFNNSTCSIDGSGRMTNTAQPCFYAFIPSNDNNVTGDGTTYTLGTNVAFTKSFDNGSNFSTNGIFTAPVTGKYYFSGSCLVGGIGILFTSSILSIATPLLTLTILGNPGALINASGQTTIHLSGIVSLNASDTATFKIQVSGSTKTADVIGGNGSTYFQGFLIC